jgi:hypothetical protein
MLLLLLAQLSENVAKLRAAGEAIARFLNEDEEVNEAFAKAAETKRLSDYCEKVVGFDLEDEALTIIQSLVDNSRVGQWLVNAYWGWPIYGRLITLLYSETDR